MSTTSSTTIEHLECRYLVPREHPAPEVVRVHLDEVVRRYLVEVCSRWLTRFLDPDDPAVWLIRELNIDLSADVGSLDNAELAEIWGRQVAVSIIQAIAAGADSETGDMVRQYLNQAVYVAHFVADLARGRAWGKWYYHPFDPVSSLSTSAAIRTVMTREPEQIDEILVHLAAQKRLEAVLQSLSEHDARIIYEQGVPADSADAGRASLVELALSVWASAALELSSKRLATPHNALRLFAAMQERSTTLHSSVARTTIDHLLRFAEVLRSVSQPAKLVAHLIADDLTGAIQLLRGTGMMPYVAEESLPGDEQITAFIQLLRGTGMMSYVESLSFLQQVAMGDAALIRRVAATVATSVAIVTPQNQGRAPTRDTLTMQSFTTLLGGVFLLLPSFLDLKLHALVETALYPAPAGERLAPLLRYLLYLKCFGLLHAQWAEIAHDPVLLLLAGLDETPSPEVLLLFSQAATVEINDLCQQVLLERLERYKHLEGRYLYLELAEAPQGDPLLLIRDMRYDTWVYARYLSAEAHAIWGILMQGLTLLQKAVDTDPEYLVLGPGFEKLTGLEEFYHLYKRPIQLVWTEPMPFPGAISHQPSSTGGDGENAVTLWTRAQALPPEIEAMFVRYLRRIKPASSDLAYLTLSAHQQPLVSNGGMAEPPPMAEPPLMAEASAATTIHAMGAHQQSLINNRDVDLAWSLIARALMRAFARRLMGFDQSSMEYLYYNFLAGTSTVHVEQDLVEVQLPCSPLHVILRMAGVDGQSYALPWLNDTQITLGLTC